METLYHYCSSSTFLSIISNNSIWLSSLSLSNDTMEGHIVRNTLNRMLTEGKISQEKIVDINNALDIIDNLIDGLGFCLSSEPDLLSQWRGYADDGQGFSIGFSREYLEERCKEKSAGEFTIFLKEVLYETFEHEQILLSTYEILKNRIESGSLKKPSPFGMKRPGEFEKMYEQYLESFFAIIKSVLGLNYKSMYAMKNKAFSEEKEWRLITLFSKGSNDSSFFRSCGNRLVPYKMVDLKDLKAPIITKVFIGPKNITPDSLIRKLLIQNGFNDVIVDRSSATYR